MLWRKMHHQHHRHHHDQTQEGNKKHTRGGDHRFRFVGVGCGCGYRFHSPMSGVRSYLAVTTAFTFCGDITVHTAGDDKQFQNAYIWR